MMPSYLLRHRMTLAVLLWATASPCVDAGDLPRLEIDAESVERGHYRLRGEATVAAGPDALLAILTAFEQHCEDSCRYALPSLDRIEVVKSEGERTVTWTQIDDLMDAHYFTSAVIHRSNGSVRLELETPAEEELQELISETRPHDPFFHRQRVTWHLEPGTEGTVVRVEMEMWSEKWLINLMPSQVLDGSRNYLEKVFEHLGSAGESP